MEIVEQRQVKCEFRVCITSCGAGEYSMHCGEGERGSCVIQSEEGAS